MEGGFFASKASAKIKLHTLMLFSFAIKNWLPVVCVGGSSKFFR